MTDAIRMTKRARAVVDRLRGGQVLHAQADQREEVAAKGGLSFWLEPSGQRVGPVTAREVIRLPVVEALPDGLFPDAPQSWRYAAAK